VISNRSVPTDILLPHFVYQDVGKAIVWLQEQPFRVLVTLLEHAGNVVTREGLRRELWPTDTFVDFEHGLNAAVKQLRDALGESAEKPRFVETLARRGYRFIAPVDKPGAPPLAPHRDGARSARATCTACDCSDRRGAGHRRAGWVEPKR
jgi:DNA-binding winged helix-turn-helix (wHTH) protein